ncbi:MAG: magnesium transporter [Robiginitomaculum sp.]|nr:MAG: magnesium transporter [Robiginitomaculum sp.]
MSENKNPRDNASTTEELTRGVHVDTQVVDEVRIAVAQRDATGVGKALDELDPADAADVVEQLSANETQAAARLAPEAFGGDVLAELSDDALEDVVESLNPTQIADAINDMEFDDAVQLIEELGERLRDGVLSILEPGIRDSIKNSLKFEEDSAGRLMQREFVTAPQFWTVGQLIDHVRKAPPDTLPEIFYEVYVVDPAFHPIGSVALSSLLRAKPATTLTEVMAPLRAVVTPQMDQEDAAYLFEKYDLPSAPVVDAEGRLTGMIMVDDIVEVLQEEHTEDMLALAGVNEAGLADTILETVRSRVPWLAINLGTAILASGVIAMFSDIIAKIVALAVLAPIVASMGGNAGTQGLAVAVRAIASRDITSANVRRIILREITAGLINGLIFAAIMGPIAYLWFHSVLLSVVIGAAMLINLLIAGLAGILVPLGLKKLGADPAVASSVFVTTATDVIGFFVFLGLATLILL